MGAATIRESSRDLDSSMTTSNLSTSFLSVTGPSLLKKVPFSDFGSRVSVFLLHLKCQCLPGL